MDPAEGQCQSACTFHPYTVHTCLQYLSQTHQHIRFGSSCATKTEFHLTRERRTAKRCRAWSQLRALKIPQQRQPQERQQLRQAMADVVQQFRNGLNETVNGRVDMLNGIATALQSVSAKPAASQPYRISWRISTCQSCTWGGKRGLMKRRCVSAMRAPTSSTAARTCSGLFISEEEFRTIEASLHQEFTEQQQTNQEWFRNRRDSKCGAQS